MSADRLCPLGENQCDRNADGRCESRLVTDEICREVGRTRCCTRACVNRVYGEMSEKGFEPSKLDPEGDMFMAEVLIKGTSLDAFMAEEASHRRGSAMV